MVDNSQKWPAASPLEITVDVPPEVTFHRYFQLELPPAYRRIYRGKADLDRLEPWETQLLTGIQAMFNEALANERAGDPARPPGSRFHFDYIDADAENAMAFQYEGYSFIGVSIGFCRGHYRLARALGQSNEVLVTLALRTDLEADGLAAIILRTQLIFIVAHEYTHHAHGHASRSSGSTLLDEFGPEGSRGLERQIEEVDADGYAVYLALANLIAGDDRPKAIAALRIESASAIAQDRFLLETFVAALGAHFIARSPRVVDRQNVYDLTHPPPSTRLHFVMQHVALWSGQYRLHLALSMTPTRFQVVMRAVANAIWGSGGSADWSAQVAFLTSNPGREYTNRLIQRLDAYKTRLQSFT